jgi:hypothetical protein
MNTLRKPILVLAGFVFVANTLAVGQNIVGNPTASQVISQPMGTEFNVNRFEAVRYADQFDIGADVGAQIMAAYNDCPSTGGCHIKVPGKIYTSVTTNIVFGPRPNSVPAVPVWLECDPGATIIDFVGSGTAISLNWGNYNSNPGQSVAHPGIFGCVINGNGGSTIGIEMNAGNGVSQTVIDGVTVTGFGTGIDFADSANPSFLTTVENTYVSANSTGINVAVSAENLRFDHNCICNNHNAVLFQSTATTGDYYFQNNSFDSNTSTVLKTSSSASDYLFIRSLDNHIENNTGGAVQDLIQIAGGILSSQGDKIVIDATGDSYNELYEITGGALFLSDVVITSGSSISHLASFSNAASGSFRDVELIYGFAPGSYYSASGAGQICVYQLSSPQIQCVNAESSTAAFGINGASVLNISSGGGGSSISINPGTGGTTVNGSLSVTGNKQFKIDHPLDPANKYLYHSSVESPDMKNIYDGIAVLDINGEAEVQLPDWFEALNRDFRYQLTCIGGFAPVYVSREIEKNHFLISGGTPALRVSWQVTGIRHDPYANAYRSQVEEEKPISERGHYLHPELFRGASPPH